MISAQVFFTTWALFLDPVVCVISFAASEWLNLLIIFFSSQCDHLWILAFFLLCAQFPINHNFLLWPCSSANSTTTVSIAKSPHHQNFCIWHFNSWNATLQSLAEGQSIKMYMNHFLNYVVTKNQVKYDISLNKNLPGS